MKRNYLIKLICICGLLLLVSCGNKSNQGKGLVEAVTELVDPHANTVDMGFKSDDGKPLYWAKGNLIVNADGTVRIASEPEYIAPNRYYADGVQEWDLIAWADLTGKKLATDDLDLSSPKVIAGNPDYDIATKLGGKWRLPTYTEIRQLFYNSRHDWCEVNGVKGMKLTSTINYNSIFLPAAGTRKGTKVENVGKFGEYMSGTVDPKYGFAICGVVIHDEGFNACDHWYRSISYSIRPVTE